MARRIEVKVYDADGTTFVRTLTEDRDRAWLDEHNEVGSWSLVVPVGSADDAALTDGRIVRFFVDGVARFPGLIGPRRKVAADPDKRLSGRDVTVSGRGCLALLERAVIYPELGVGAQSPKNRRFDWTSKDYDDSGWTAAVELAQQGDDNPVTNPKTGRPAGWPDDLGWWVWDATGFTPPAAVGDVYFRRGNYDITNTTDIRNFIAVDDNFEFVFDAETVGVEDGIGAWGESRYLDTRVTGSMEHTFAIKGTNVARPDPGTNGAAMLFYACELLDGGDTLGPAIARSDSAWKKLAYPATPPGMTAGQILDVLLTEAQARGTLTAIAWDFDAALDSDGVAWPTELGETWPVGLNYLEVGRHLIDEHVIDLAFDPATMTLHAYVSRGADLTAGVAAVLGPSAGANIARLGFTKNEPGPNAVLGMSAAGVWTETTDPTAIAAYDRREVALSFGSATDDTGVARQSEAFLADNANPVEEIDDLQLEVVPGGPQPWVDFDVADRITGPLYAGGDDGYQLGALGVTEDAAGNPIYTPELIR